MRILRIFFQAIIILILKLRLRFLTLRLAKAQREKDEVLETFRDQIVHAVGQLTVEWAYVESQLDDLCLLILNNGGRENVGEALPRALQRKLDFIKSVSRKHPWLFFHGSILRNNIADLRVLSEYRHDLVHGTLTVTDRNRKTDTTFFTRNIYSAASFKTSEHIFNVI